MQHVGSIYVRFCRFAKAIWHRTDYNNARDLTQSSIVMQVINLHRWISRRVCYVYRKNYT